MYVLIICSEKNGQWETSDEIIEIDINSTKYNNVLVILCMVDNSYLFRIKFMFR